VIPAWNEQETIGQAVQEAVAALGEVAADHEVIVVDDGSTDATADLVRAEAAANPRVRLAQHPRNLGYGAALRTGFGAARLDLVAFTDADCQFDLADLAHMLPLTRRFDLTCGYRIDRQDPPRRRFFSWGYNTLAGLLLGTHVRDLDCALKVFHRAQLPAFLPQSDNYFANAEMLTRARQAGLSVVEVGVRHRPRAAGASKVSWREVPRTLGKLLPFWWSRVLFPALAQVLGAGSPAQGAGLPTPPHGRRWFWTALVFLAVLAGGLLFPRLSYPLIEPDEGRYGEIGREMAAGGDWVVPTLNHQPYYDKPPMVYWLVAASCRLFGPSEWAARLVPTGAAFLTVLATFLFGARSLGPRPAFLAALALTLMAGFVLTGRVLTLDGVLTLFVALALFTGYEAVRGRRLRRRWWLTSAVCCGLGVLTKGPIAFVLFAPPLVAHLRLRGRARFPGLAPWGAYVGVVLAVVAPWFLLITAHDPAFATRFVVDHHLKRFFVGTEHPQPVWYFVPVLALACLPWSLLLIPFTRFLFTRAPEVRALRPPALGFFLLWAGWCFAVFSLSRGKLPLYILPALPGIALALGCYLEQVVFQTHLPALFGPARSRVMRVTAGALAAAWLALGTGAYLKGLTGLGACLAVGGVSAGCLAGVALWGRKVGPRAGWALVAVLTAAMILETGQGLAPAFSARRFPLSRSEELIALPGPGSTAVACHGQEWGSITFRSGGEIFDLGKRPLAELTAFLAGRPRTLVVISGSQLKCFRPLVPPGMSLTPVGGGDGTVIALVHSPGERH
jgi:dolichol-phosphate mannosyltransferase